MMLYKYISFNVLTHERQNGAIEAHKYTSRMICAWNAQHVFCFLNFVYPREFPD